MREILRCSLLLWVETRRSYWGRKLEVRLYIPFSSISLVDMGKLHRKVDIDPLL